MEDRRTREDGRKNVVSLSTSSVLSRAMKRGGDEDIFLLSLPLLSSSLTRASVHVTKGGRTGVEREGTRLGREKEDMRGEQFLPLTRACAPAREEWKMRAKAREEGEKKMEKSPPPPYTRTRAREREGEKEGEGEEDEGMHARARGSGRRGQRRVRRGRKMEKKSRPPPYARTRAWEREEEKEGEGEK